MSVACIRRSDRRPPRPPRLRAGGTPAAPRLAAQLQAGLMQRPIAVHAARRKLAAIGVQRERTVQGDPLGPLDERTGLAVTADAQASSQAKVRKVKPS